MAKLNLLRTVLILSVSLFLCGAAAKTDVGLSPNAISDDFPRYGAKPMRVHDRRGNRGRHP